MRREENRSTRRKTSRSKNENQQQTQPTYDAGSGNRTRATLVGGECFHHCAIFAPLKVNICISCVSFPSLPLAGKKSKKSLTSWTQADSSCVLYCEECDRPCYLSAVSSPLSIESTCYWKNCRKSDKLVTASQLERLVCDMHSDWSKINDKERIFQVKMFFTKP